VRDVAFHDADQILGALLRLADRSLHRAWLRLEEELDLDLVGQALEQLEGLRVEAVAPALGGVETQPQAGSLGDDDRQHRDGHGETHAHQDLQEQ
jgi:hypothetical protein